ncbi:hypothetical protein 2209_scaffold2350_00024 [Bacteriophage sp.]|nr:hypothetical protein 2209_scaffold2350_00024 [Bacteriophage sp.]
MTSSAVTSPSSSPASLRLLRFSATTAIASSIRPEMSAGATSATASSVPSSPSALASACSSRASLTQALIFSVSSSASIFIDLRPAGAVPFLGIAICNFLLIAEFHR